MHPRTSVGKVEYLDLFTVSIANEDANNENLYVLHAQNLPSMTRYRYPDSARLSTYDTCTENFCLREVSIRGECLSSVLTSMYRMDNLSR
jgi:hypothetical protein